MLYLFAALLALFAGLALVGWSQTSRSEIFPEQENIDTTLNRRATFSVWSFWDAKLEFETTEGVLDVVLGFAWWEEEFPSLLDVKRGLTGHRFAVQVVYNTEYISYWELLQIFRSLIDPTDEDGQFEQRGFPYTTAIRYHSLEQHDLAVASFEHQDSTWAYPLHIVTEILPYDSFYLVDTFNG